ncbi:SDR family oxidoreductase [Novosphingobium sp. YJ-S2-02]|uniref:SDR family oxidoreductase n=1 Tax=Novosphingobium aureum TaxID=2792964 RepID=A0A931HEE8_9SPHN|nr:D-erythronate dehydrogenase [Novosphingobium aureum]MBH0113856.1 SDR family oxidoreductase [Novosphingobium aureum]
MKIVITGGGGFLGQRLARALLARDVPTEPAMDEIATSLVLFDRDFPEVPVDPRISVVRGSVTDAGALEALVDGADVVFHLAAVVSGQAEADFDLGMEVNVQGSQTLLEACRKSGNSPRVVFTSSVAVFGPVSEDAPLSVAPRSSYGAEKAIAELLLAEYTRRGFVDGVVLRLPTISVRPGLPNQAASSFASGIVREPLCGKDTVCPVAPDLPLWLLSPRHAIANLVHAGDLPAAMLGANPIVDLPGLSVTVAQMVEALEAVAGSEPLEHIAWCLDPAVERIVASWPARWDDSRARALGFTSDSSFDQTIRDFLEEMNAGPSAPLAAAC